VPVVPAFIRGTDKALPKGARFIKPQRVSVYFGKQIFIERRMPYQDIARRVMEEIRRLAW
jgi:1-acyl-sn-glycerol-3-phosphate acyltransferase